MKFYVGDFKSYYLNDEQSDVSENTIHEQVQLWHEALNEQLQSAFDFTLDEQTYFGSTIEISDDDFYHLCACSLQIEAKKIVTSIYSLDHTNKLYEKWENGFIETKMQALLNARCWFPNAFPFTFSFVDPAENETAFSSLIALSDCLQKVLQCKWKSEAITKAKETALQLSILLDEAIKQHTLLIQVA